MNVLDGNNYSKYYCKIQGDGKLPEITALFGYVWKFMQNGASLHGSNSTTEGLDDNYVRVMAWPAKLADIKIIDNIWSRMVRSLFIRKVASFKTLKPWVIEASMRGITFLFCM